jgi:Dolichyl-phosphate-mannose-protein mannosyltransferase
MKYAAQIAFFLVLLAIELGIYRDYGISWDEPRSRINGLVTFKYVAERFALSRLADAASREVPLNEYVDRDYGVAFEAPAVALEVMLRIGDEQHVFMFRHLLTFLVALAGIYAVKRMAHRRFSDWRIGLLAALFLVLTPRLFAESFYNSKDVVFMAFFAIAMNTTISFVLKPRLKTAVLHALASALAIDVRIVAVILPVAAVAILIVRLLKGELPIAATCRALAVYLAAAGILVTAMWPWLWSDPIGNFVQAFRNMSTFRWNHEVLYMGSFVHARLPWHYIPVWISITTPLLYLALFLVGVFNTLRQIASRGTSL